MKQPPSDKPHPPVNQSVAQSTVHGSVFQLANVEGDVRISLGAPGPFEPLAGAGETSSDFFPNYLPYPRGIERAHRPICQELVASDVLQQGRALVLIGTAGVGKTWEAKRLLFQSAPTPSSDLRVFSVRMLSAIGEVIRAVREQPLGARLLLVDDILGSVDTEFNAAAYQRGLQYLEQLLLRDQVTVVATSRDLVWDAIAPDISRDLLDETRLIVPPDLILSWREDLLRRKAAGWVGELTSTEVANVRYLETPKDITAFAANISRVRRGELTTDNAIEDSKHVPESYRAEFRQMLRSDDEFNRSAAELGLLVLALDGIDRESLQLMSGDFGLLAHASFNALISRIKHVLRPEGPDGWGAGFATLWHDDVYLGVWDAARSDPTRGAGRLGALLATAATRPFLEVRPTRRLFRLAGEWAESGLAVHLAQSPDHLANWVTVWERHENLLIVAGDMSARMIDQLRLCYQRLRPSREGVLAAKLYGHCLYMSNMRDKWEKAREVWLDAWGLLGGYEHEARLPDDFRDHEEKLRLATFIATHIGLCFSKDMQPESALEWYAPALEAGQLRLELLRVELARSSPADRYAARERVSDAEFLLHEAENHKANTLQAEIGDYVQAIEFYVKAFTGIRRIQAEDPGWRPPDVVSQDANLSALLGFTLARRPSEVIAQALDETALANDGKYAAIAAEEKDPVLALVSWGEQRFRQWEELRGLEEPVSHPRRANLARARVERLMELGRYNQAMYVCDGAIAALNETADFRRGLLLVQRAEIEVRIVPDKKVGWASAVAYLDRAIEDLHPLERDRIRAETRRAELLRLYAD